MPHPFRYAAKAEPQEPEPARRPTEASTTAALAARHEALWLALSALHNDTIALGAKKPGAPVSDAARIQAESLLADCAPFIRRSGERLPVAAPDLVGLALQLGQALAALDAWESRRTSWDDRFQCRIWHLNEGWQPVLRLKPPAAAISQARTATSEPIRRKLLVRFEQRERGAYQAGFTAGLAAAQGSRPAAAESGRSAAAPTDSAAAEAPHAPAYPRPIWGV